MMKSSRLAATALTLGITITSITGCSLPRQYVLQGTLLAETVVAKVDENIAVVRPRSSDLTCSGINETVQEHKHYFDVVSGQWMTDSEHCTNREVLKDVTIEEIGSIFSYLTQDEMLKANEGKLTEEDVIKIIYRIKESEKEEPKSLTKTK